jgi:hypothetical protein
LKLVARTKLCPLPLDAGRGLLCRPAGGRGHAGGRPGAGRADVVQVTTPSPERLAANGLAPAAER